MKIYHLRNATFVIESDQHFILIDPMLGGKGTLPPFSVFKSKARMNPLVPLPDNAPQILDKVTHCLITHSRTFGITVLQHTDHLDNAGENFLKKNNIPVGCRTHDADYLRKKGIHVETTLDYWRAEAYLGGEITAIPAQHGHGWIHHLMANGAGFFLRLPDEPSIYISGDTVFTDDVKHALMEMKPDISVMASGSARMDVGQAILMPVDELVAFVRHAPGKVIANHLEALNHCPTTRIQLNAILEENNLITKTMIPEDGEMIAF